MLAILMERVLTSFGLSALKKRQKLGALYERRKKPSSRYGIGDAINDVYLLGEISTKEFELLKDFQRDRNDYVHNIFTRPDDEIERRADNLFEKHQPTFELMVEKLEESLPA